MPLPQPAAPWIGQALRRLGVADFSAEQMRFLAYGRVVDTSRMRDVLGFTPRYSTREAFDDFVARQGLHGPLSARRRAGRRAARVLDVVARSGGSRRCRMPDARVIPIGGDDRAARGRSAAARRRRRRRRRAPAPSGATSPAAVRRRPAARRGAARRPSATASPRGAEPASAHRPTDRRPRGAGRSDAAPAAGRRPR